MNQQQASSILNNMIAFIEKHGDEEVAKITKSMDDEFTVQKNNHIE